MRVMLLLNQTPGHRFAEYHDGDAMEPGWLGFLYEASWEGIDRSSDVRILDGLYEVFNIDHPAGYDNRSMSVGDVITLEDEDGRRSYACECAGWRRLADVVGGKYMDGPAAPYED